MSDNVAGNAAIYEVHMCKADWEESPKGFGEAAGACVDMKNFSVNFVNRFVRRSVITR